MSTWSHVTAERNSDFDNYMETLAEPPVPPKAPDIATRLVDVAAAEENPRTYIPEEGDKKPFEEKQAAGVNMNQPVDISETGFRSDIAEAMIKFFKEKRAMKDKLDGLRNKMGMR